MIGLKLANGRFFPVLEETDKGTKRVVLTTAHSNQAQVKVDLYRGHTESDPSSWEYIASLVLEHIPPSRAGTPEMELVLRLTDTHTLDAKIRDERSGEYQSLRIDIESLDYGDFSLPDFELETEPEPIPLFFKQEPSYPSLQPPATESGRRPKSNRKPLFYKVLTAFLVLCILILGILGYFWVKG